MTSGYYGKKVIKDPTQHNNERIAMLHQFIADGQDAEVLLKYAYKLKQEFQEDYLNISLTNKDITDARNYYKIACRFVSNLEFAARLGQQKEDVLVNIKQNE